MGVSSATHMCKVVLYSANPEGTVRLALDEEIRDIESQIRTAKYREFILIPKLAVRPDDLLQT